MKKKDRKRLLESSDGTVGSPTEVRIELLPRKRKPTDAILKKMYPIRVGLYDKLKELLMNEIKADKRLDRRIYGMVNGWDRSVWPLEIGPIQFLLSDEYKSEDLFGCIGRIISIIKKGFSDKISCFAEQNIGENPKGTITVEADETINGSIYQFELSIDVMIYVRSDVHRLDKIGTAIILWDNGQNDVRL